MSERIKLLIVDDDAEIRELLGQLLVKYGYNVILARNGIEMFGQLEKQKFDLIILDIMMPGEDGFSLCQKLRRTSVIPIIMLTAAGEETDRIVGLEMGADDYLAKPFNPRELLARIKAVLRRTGKLTIGIESEEEDVEPNAVVFLGWTLIITTRRLFTPDKLEIVLSAGEYDLLMAFIDSPQKVLSRDQLLDYTKSRTAGPFDRSIDVQVSRIRQKLEDDPKNPQIIKTVRGGGYLFTPKVEKRHVDDE